MPILQPQKCNNYNIENIENIKKKSNVLNQYETMTGRNENFIC